MKRSSLLLLLLAAIVLMAPTALGASIDMDDPRRAVGRENDVRVDAQIIQDTVSPGSPVGVVFQIQNLSDVQIAVADKLVSASYDSDSQTITLGIGAEVPEDGKLPRMVTIEPGEKKVFRGGATPAMNIAAIRSRLEAAPRYVRVKVTVMRKLAEFANLIRQGGSPVLSDEQFDRWFEANDTIFLNSIPVRFSPRARSSGVTGAERRDLSGGF